MIYLEGEHRLAAQTVDQLHSVGVQDRVQGLVAAVGLVDAREDLVALDEVLLVDLFALSQGFVLVDPLDLVAVHDQRASLWPYGHVVVFVDVLLWMQVEHLFCKPQKVYLAVWICVVNGVEIVADVFFLVALLEG